MDRQPQEHAPATTGSGPPGLPLTSPSANSSISDFASSGRASSGQESFAAAAEPATGTARELGPELAPAVASEPRPRPPLPPDLDLADLEHCPQCEYSIVGLPPSCLRCPECDADLSLEARLKAREARMRRFQRRLFLFFGLPTLILVACFTPQLLGFVVGAVAVLGVVWVVSAALVRLTMAINPRLRAIVPTAAVRFVIAGILALAFLSVMSIAIVLGVSAFLSYRD